MSFFKFLDIPDKKANKGILFSLVGLVFVAVVPLLIFCSGVAWMIVDKKKDAVAEKLASTTRALLVAVDHELQSQFTAMNILASDISPESVVRGDFQERAHRAVKANSQWRNIGLIDPHSHRIILASPTAPTPTPLTISPHHVDEVVRTKKPLIAGTFATSKITQGPIILLMSPVMRGNEVHYVLGVAMDSKSISNIFTEQQLAPSWTGAVVDAQMILAGRSRDPQRYVGVRSTQSLIDHISASTSGMFTAVNQEGATVYTVFSRSIQTGWSVAIGVPADELEGPIRLVLLQLVASGGILVTFALLLAWIVGRVIVQRRNTYEQALLESESRFRLMADTAPVFIWICDTNKRCIWLNQVGIEFTGRALEQHLGNGWAESIHPDDIQRCGTAFSAAFEHRQPFTIEFRLRRADGRYCWVLDKGIPLYEHNQFIGYIGSGTDISDRRSAEAALQQLNEEKTIILENAGVGISFVQDRRQMWANPAFCRMFGCTSEEIFEVSTEIFYPSREEFEQLGSEVYHALSLGETVSKEVMMRRFDGTLFHARLAGKAVNPADPSAGSIWILSDETTQKELERELLAAREAAESANRAKSIFLANMSHEIRTPMNGVIGVAQLLAMTELTAEQKEYVDILNVSGKNLLSLINDILDLSKIEAGKIEIELSEFSLQECISSIVLTQKPAISQKGLSLDLVVADTIPAVLLGDQLRVKQILLNLLGNAVKFTSQGGISISAEVLEKDDSSVLIQITVDDTGVGISPETLENIFQPFVQEDGSISRKYGGTGLGLTISRRLAELMNGSISVRSTQDLGSCFTVCLPFTVMHTINAAQETPRNPVFNDEGPQLRILFAEDDQTNITLGMSLLKKLGHTVVVAENGRECLRELELGTFDFVLMDIQMPVMSGEEALGEIRKKERGTPVHQRVIALTAYAQRGEKERFLEEGFDGYVSKPLDIPELVTELQRLSGSNKKPVAATEEERHEETIQNSGS